MFELQIFLLQLNKKKKPKDRQIYFVSDNSHSWVI